MALSGYALHGNRSGLVELASGPDLGANAMTLVSGGTVAHVLLIVAVFILAWRVFGRSVAIGSLVPLTFASTGVLWLSGRITGGHLLIVAWSAVAWLLLLRDVGTPGLAASDRARVLVRVGRLSRFHVCLDLRRHRLRRSDCRGLG